MSMLISSERSIKETQPRRRSSKTKSRDDRWRFNRQSKLRLRRRD
jgi:hypothetical protein